MACGLMCMVHRPTLLVVLPGGGGAIAGQRHTPREPQHPSVNDDALSQL